MGRRICALLIAFCLILGLTSCNVIRYIYGLPPESTPRATQEQEEEEEEEEETAEETAEWSIYLYLCGSDLETDGGCATVDLNELLEADLPQGVQVVIETGGAQEWQNTTVDPSVLQRYVYDRSGFELVDEAPSASMGDPDTLADFLEFASDNYPADKTAVILWNHGGGTVAGVAFDELYGYDSLTLDELHEAFDAVWDLSVENPPVELIGFDACLMATVDVAWSLSDVSRYMVASQEIEPGNGWYYSAWMDALADNPSMDGAALGKIICDTFYEGCELEGAQDSVTLSLVDMSLVGPLVDAYDAFGGEALGNACEDAGFISRFGRIASTTENYGGNTREQGYTNMVDLGDLAQHAAAALPDTYQAVLDALDACVLYTVAGPYRSQSMGLSCYYSYDGDLGDFRGYENLGASAAFKYFYSYALTGDLNESGMEYIAAMDYYTLPELVTLNDMNWDDMPLAVDDQGCAVLTLGPQAYDVLSGIYFQLYYMDEDNDLLLLLGTDNDIIADWDNGVFKDNFRGVWGAIDGCIVYMELSCEGDDYNLYSVPVLLNGEDYNLVVAYDFTLAQWSILGAQRGIDENGMADRQLRQLVPGDQITTIQYKSSISDVNEDFYPYSVETITVTDTTSFGEAELPDGEYVMMYEMRDAQGNTAYSDLAMFECEGGSIYTSVFNVY